MASLNRRKSAGLINAELGAELHESLVDLRRSSFLFDEQVGQKCGVERNTLKRWLGMGVTEGAQEPYLSFARDYSEASIEVENKALNAILEAKQGKDNDDWRAIAWWLERWKPTRWGKCVPEAGPREDIDIQHLVQDAVHRTQTLAELFEQPPPELEKAMRQNREAILAVLAQEPAEPELPEG